MLEALVLANSAYQVIRQTIQNGREISSAGQAIANFVNAEDQLQQDLHKKKNSMWTAFLGKTDNDLEEFMALEEIKRKKDTLREYMQLYGRPGLYTDWIAYCSEQRRKRKEALIARKKKRQQMQDMILKVILGILITALFSGVITVLVIIAKKRGLI